MQVTIKPHSSLRQFFSSDLLKADLTTFYDIVFYLNAMQPKFIDYLKRQKDNKVQESYVFLDKNLKQVNLDELRIRRVKDGEIIHIVPAIVGGGGKRGLLALFAIFAVFAFVFVAAGAAAAGAAAPIGASAGAAGGIGGMLAGLSPFMQNILVNIGLALLSALFARPEQKTESTRENNAFGSLVNSTNSGTPIALHYGQVRVAGQLISGYISTLSHSKSQEVDAYGQVSEKNK